MYNTVVMVLRVGCRIQRGAHHRRRSGSGNGCIVGAVRRCVIDRSAVESRRRPPITAIR